VLWILAAIFLVAVFSIGIAMWRAAESTPVVLLQLWRIIPYYPLLASIIILLSLLSLAAAVGLLRLKQWARSTLIRISWCGVAWQACGMVFMAVYIIGDPQYFSWMTSCLIGGIVMASPFLFTIWTLKRPSVQASFNGGGSW
jgi:hypothetical protein